MRAQGTDPEQELPWFSPETFEHVLNCLTPSGSEGNRKIALNLENFGGGPDMEVEKEQVLSQILDAFKADKTVKKLRLLEVVVGHKLVAETLKAGFEKDEIEYIEFVLCKEVGNQTLMDIMCEGLQEKSRGFRLCLYGCQLGFMTPIIAASYSTCIALELERTVYLPHSMRSFLSRAPLEHIKWDNLRKPNEKDNKKDNKKDDKKDDNNGFDLLELGRCVSVMPHLTSLNLMGTVVSEKGFKRLYSSLKEVLSSEATGVLKELMLGGQKELSNNLCFAYFRLLGSDKLTKFGLTVRNDVSREVRKNISSTVANTKNLTLLMTWHTFTSDTNFKEFKLEVAEKLWKPPYDVNPHS